MTNYLQRVDALEHAMRARIGRESIEHELILERARLTRMFDQAKSVVANWQPGPMPDEWDGGDL